MKRSTFIIIIFVIILALFGAWVYSLLYGSPETREDLFARFDFFGGEETDITPIITETPTPEPEPELIPPSAEKLRQLTTRPVIGFREIAAASTSPQIVLYVEAGTGHIYQLNLTTGEDTRVSNVTIPTASRAEISPSGEYVAIRSGYTTDSELALITLGTEVQSTILPTKASSFYFSHNNELLVAEVKPEGTTITSIHPVTQAAKPLYTIPFQNSTIVWSEHDTVPHYVYPKATNLLQGYLYQLKLGTIYRVPLAGDGLTAEANATYIVSGTRANEFYQSSIFNITNNSTTPAPIIFLPEKCVFRDANSSLLFCGYDLTASYTHEFPNNWYKGDISFSDRIWKVDLEKLTASQLVAPVTVAGREIDITRMSIDGAGGSLYFINKHDNYLWTYEI